MTGQIGIFTDAFTPLTNGQQTQLRVDKFGRLITVSGDGNTDTQGNAVPTYGAHSYTYDDSGNIKTDTVSDGAATWVRTFSYANGQLATDSGWVRQ